jgi:hypothetical protein
LGFFAGVANNQAGDISTRADDCETALSKYNTGILEVRARSAIFNGPKATQQELYETSAILNRQYLEAFAMVLNNCPMNTKDYLNPEDVIAWVATHTRSLISASRGVNAIQRKRRG